VTNATWAVRLPVVEVEALGPLRTSSLTILPTREEIWVLGGPDPALDSPAIQKLPATKRYRLEPTDPGKCFPPRGHVAVALLPPGKPIPLPQWLGVTLPGSLPATPFQPMFPLQLVAASVSPGNLAGLMAPFALFRAWALGMLSARLAPLTMALAADDTALVLGQPPPPLPGTYLWQTGRVLGPVGFAWDPPLDPGSLTMAFGLPNNALLLLTDQGGEAIPDEAFVPVTQANLLALGDR
jgi:hypothetical protein